MRTGFLRHLYDSQAPYITVWMDASYDTEDARPRSELRWRGIREALVDEGADPRELRPLDDAIGPAALAGDQSQLLVEANGQVVFGEHLPIRPGREIADRSALPHLMPWLVARSQTWVHPYLLVLVDRHGADIQLCDIHRRHEAVTVDVGAEPVEKNNPGGWSQLRYQRSAEEAWIHNSKGVAESVDTLRRRYRPELVVLSGDVRARALLMEYLTPASLEVTVEAGDIDRQAGASSESLRQQIEEVLDLRQESETEQSTQRYEEAQAHDRASDGLANVVGALVRGGVDTMLVNQSFMDDATVWTGPGPLQLGLSREDVMELGVSADELVEERADAALVRALVRSDGDLVSVDPDRLAMRDGVGAVLRYTDQAAT